MNRFTALLLPSCMALSSCIAVTGVAISDEPATQLANRFLQDELDELPEDNTAFFSEAQEVKLQLDLLSALEDARSLSETVVTVIRPDGESEELRVDGGGQVVIEDVERGPHAIVASGDGVHGAMLYYFDEKEESDDALGAGLAQVETKKMTLLQVDPNDLRDSIDRVRGISDVGRMRDGDFRISKTYGYDVTLGPSGVLSGRVLSVNRGTPISGTEVKIFYNGSVVGSTQAGSDGSFQITGLRGGVHGLVASGSGGYSAFAFNAVPSSEIAQISPVVSQTFVSTLQGAGETLPVVLVPPQMIEPVVEAVEKRYPEIAQPSVPAGIEAAPAPMGTAGAPIANTFSSVAPSATGAAGAGGGFSGAGGGFGGGGGLGGGLGGLAALAPLAILPAVIDDDNDPISPVTVVSPAIP